MRHHRRVCVVIVFSCLTFISLIISPSETSSQHQASSNEPPATSIEQPYWQQFVHYRMEVSLDPATHILTGVSRILYRNQSPDTLDRIYMYLYPNGFRSNESVRGQEMAKFYQKNLPNAEAAGWLRVNEFRIGSASASDGAVLSAFEINDTILSAHLPQPLPPDGEIEIELTFTAKVKKFQDRSGYRGRQYDFAQWYPKMCVYDEEGWHAEPLHYLGEFYGEFGTFEVTINVPFEYIVAATGVVTAGDPGWSLVQIDTSLSEREWMKRYVDAKTAIAETSAVVPMRSVTFHAEQVHDFAWVTCPDFLYERGEYDGIPIHVLYRSYAKSYWSKVVTERGRRALEWLSAKFGRYPYPQLTITHGLLGGGMEYPMLVMNSNASESLILHEVGHIYFYGILGNNEQKEAWLDEGFTSFQTQWYMEIRYGPWGYDRTEAMEGATWLARRRPRLTSNEANRYSALYYMTSGHDEPISRYAHRYKNGIAYGVNAYTKGSIFFEMLRFVVGEEAFEKICKEYFKRWALKHVNEARFREVCEEVSGMDLEWFFQQWLHETKTVDYRLGKVRSEQLAVSSWKTEVEIKRNDAGIMPVEVELTLNDGQKFVQRWEGKESKGILTFNTPSKPRQVVLDPNDQIMDKKRFGHGNLHVEIYPEYPYISSYSPSDAYVLAWKPSAWYNDVDGLRFGAKLKGRYRNTRNLELGAWYGAKSGAFDGTISFSDRLGSRFTYKLAAQKLEGRYLGDLSLSAAFSRALFTPPQLNMTLGFSYSELPAEKSDYAFSEVEIGDNVEAIPNWSTGKVNRAYLNFNLNPRGISWRSWFSGRIAHANEAFGSDAAFTRLEGEAHFWIPKARGSGIYLRGFAGAFVREQDDKPLQDLFSAFGASSREQFDKFYLRSRGALPAEVHYHLPGGGNLRGYYDQPDLAGKNLLAGNLELRQAWRIPLLGRWLQPVLGSSVVAAFFDFGYLNPTSEEAGMNLADAGLGFTFDKEVPDTWYSFFIGTEYTLRLDFPIWVSRPPLRAEGDREEEVKFRYVMSLQRAL